jgi:hypothetical protein
MPDPTPEAPSLGFPPQNPALTPWAAARRALEVAKLYWLSTVRRDGRPHVVPVWGVWLDDTLIFSTSPASLKARNLANNPRCAVSVPGEALDLAIEGELSTCDDAVLQRAAALYSQKYDFPVAARDGGFYNRDGHGGPAFVVRPLKAFGFGDPSAFSATRWVFGES